MDFSFVEESPTGRPPGQQTLPGPRPPQGPQAGAQPRPLVQLPTWQEVQAAKQPSAPTILFRPTGLMAAVRQQQQPLPQRQHGPPQAAGAAPATTFPAPTAPAGPGPAAAAVAAVAAVPRPPRALQGPEPCLGPGPGPGSGSGPRPGLGPSVNSALLGGGGGGGGGSAGGGPGPQPYGASPPFGTYHGQLPVAGGGAGAVAAAAVPAPPPNVVLVNRRQQGNPVLKHIRNVRWQFADIVPDYQLGQGTAALFLSLRYHLLHPDYILHRIREQQRMFRLTVLLTHVDVDDVVKPLGEVTRAAVVGDCTLVCAWSPEECARWLETYKSYESKPASAIQERIDPDYVSRLAAVLAGSVRGINRTDSHTLGTTFGSLAAMMRCNDADAFSACPGIGPTKVRRLMEAFHEPFRKQLKMTGVAAAGATGTAGAAAGGAAAAGEIAGRAADGASAAGATASAGLAGAGPGGTAGAGLMPGLGAAAAQRQRASGMGGGGSGAAASLTAAGAGAVEAAGDAAAGIGKCSRSAIESEHGAIDEGDGVSDEDEGEEGAEGGQEAELGEVAGAEVELKQAGRLQVGDGGGRGTGVDGAGAAGSEVESRRHQLLELLMSQMPAGDDDVSDEDEEF